MAIISCPHCSQSLNIPDSEAGQAVRCPKCQQTFRTGDRSAVASGEPPVGTAGDAAVTDKPPSPKPSVYDDSPEPAAPSIRRERASGGTSATLIVILVLGGVAMLGLCLCAPVAFFLGFVPVRMQAQNAEVVAAHEDAEVALANAAERKLIGFKKGVAEARDAIAQNKLLLKEYPPLPAPAWHGDYIKLLKEECNCDYQVIAAPKLAQDQQDEIKGWNQIMRAELRRRHGETIIDDLHKEAEKRWRDRGKAKDNK
jgi:predicted Zn finger-like uncharacterized protein